MEVEKLKETQSLILKLLEKPVNVNNYISLQQNSYNSLDSDTENKLDEKLSEIESKLNEKILKETIKNYRQTLKKSKENPILRGQLINFIKDLGDSGSPTHKILTSAGIAKTLLKSLYDLGRKLFEIV